MIKEWNKIQDVRFLFVIVALVAVGIFAAGPCDSGDDIASDHWKDARVLACGESGYVSSEAGSFVRIKVHMRLYSWANEKDGTMPAKEFRARLESLFQMRKSKQQLAGQGPAEACDKIRSGVSR